MEPRSRLHVHEKPPPAECLVPGCDAPARIRGICLRCYNRERKAGPGNDNVTVAVQTIRAVMLDPTPVDKRNPGETESRKKRGRKPKKKSLPSDTDRIVAAATEIAVACGLKLCRMGEGTHLIVNEAKRIGIYLTAGGLVRPPKDAFETKAIEDHAAQT